MFFKKKKNEPSLYKFLDVKLEEMAALGKKNFYYPLTAEEVEVAREWANARRLFLDISHQNQGAIIYKFYKTDGT